MYGTIQQDKMVKLFQMIACWTHDQKGSILTAIAVLCHWGKHFLPWLSSDSTLENARHDW